MGSQLDSQAAGRAQPSMRSGKWASGGAGKAPDT